MGNPTATEPSNPKWDNVPQEPPPSYAEPSHAQPFQEFVQQPVNAQQSQVYEMPAQLPPQQKQMTPHEVQIERNRQLRQDAEDARRRAEEAGAYGQQPQPGYVQPNRGRDASKAHQSDDVALGFCAGCATACCCCGCTIM